MRIKDFFFNFFIFSIFTLASAFVSDSGVHFYKPKHNKRKSGVKTIVIDAGHGGKDPGCAGNPKSESKITLALALKLGKLIEENLPDVKVIYTRKTDVFIELYERANIANRNNADLFISIHCNSLPSSKSVKGLEVYVMGLHTADENLQIAKKVAERENQTIVMETNYKKNYGGYDPKDPATHILLSMVQNVHIDQSINVAGMIHKECKSAGYHSRGVHQAGFVVIRATAMPSILVESGYMTNKSDNAFLQSEKGQKTLAKSIYRAVKSFKYELEGKKKEDDPIDEEDRFNPETDGETNSGETIEETNIVEPKPETNKTEQGYNTKRGRPNTGKTNNPKQSTTTENRNKEYEEPKQENREVSAKPQESQERGVENSARLITLGTPDAPLYYVQIVSNDKPIPMSSPMFRGLKDVVVEATENRYRYFTGPYENSRAAANAAKTLQAKGFKGAFVAKK